MITKKELQEYARIKGLNLGNAEKDYLIDIALKSISENTKNELVFKGGTCLYKFHKLPRFSEDLDFSAIDEIDVDRLTNKVILDFRRFGINVKQHLKKELHNSILATLKIEGPLFSKKPTTYASLGMDINKKSQVILKPEILSFSSIYPEVPVFHVFCMRKEEIFAEKIRALLTRKRARDLFDLYFMLEAGVYADREMIQKKMDYYNEKFEVEKLIRKIAEFEPRWRKEIAGFTSSLPKFEVVHKFVKEKLLSLYNSH